MSDDSKPRRSKLDDAASDAGPRPLWPHPDRSTLPRVVGSAPPPAAPSEVEYLDDDTWTRGADGGATRTAGDDETDAEYDEVDVPERRGARAVEPHPCRPRLGPPSPFTYRLGVGANPQPAITLVHAPDSPAAAQWRVLKFKLKEHGDPRVIAVTSPVRNEGKSTAAANLALSLAEGQRARVVLLEANLRTPSLGSLLGLEATRGLTNQLRRRRRESDAPWELYELASNFFFLPSGPPADNPAAMLASAEFAELLRDLRLHYDFVVVDTPAVLLAADMNIVQDLVDGVVLVCRSGFSKRPELRRALARLARHNIVGIVLVECP